MCVAYLDESEPSLIGPVYVVAAAVLDEDDRESVSASLRNLSRPGRSKLHWYEERYVRERQRIVEAIARYPVRYHAVVRTCAETETAERRRRKSLMALLADLDELDVRHVVLEARESKQNKRERMWLNSLRSQGVGGSAAWFDHVAGAKEPLLWLPDVIAGVVGAGLRGETRYGERLRDVLTVRSVAAGCTDR